MNIYQKLNAARKSFHALSLKKSGRNDFAKYNYFELGDFLLPALAEFDKVGLSAVISFNKEDATMRIVDCDKPEDSIIITSPMGSAALKGCHEVQNIGAVETYQRRYLWVAALEIVEHDAIDAGQPIDGISTAISAIKAAKDMEALKHHFDAALKMHGKNPAIITAKDVRKNELMTVKEGAPA